MSSFRSRRTGRWSSTRTSRSSTTAPSAARSARSRSATARRSTRSRSRRATSSTAPEPRRSSARRARPAPSAPRNGARPPDRLALRRQLGGAALPDPLQGERTARRLRRRRGHQPEDLGRRMADRPRPLDRNSSGSGRGHPCLGTPRRGARRRRDRRPSGDVARARRSRRAVRRATDARAAPVLHVDLRDAGRTGTRAREDRGRGARGRGRVRTRPEEDRRGARQPATDDRNPARARAGPRALDRRPRLVVLRSRARDRATTASTSRSRRPRHSRLWFRRSSRRAGRRARSSSPRPSST